MWKKTAPVENWSESRGTSVGLRGGGVGSLAFCFTLSFEKLRHMHSVAQSNIRQVFFFLLFYCQLSQAATAQELPADG